MSTVEARQGSQPTYAGIRIGIVVLGEHEGVRKARLLIRSDSDKKRVDLAAGDTEDLFGVATLTLDDVRPEPGGGGAVTLTFRDADA